MKRDRMRTFIAIMVIAAMVLLAIGAVGAVFLDDPAAAAPTALAPPAP